MYKKNNTHKQKKQKQNNFVPAALSFIEIGIGGRARDVLLQFEAVEGASEPIECVEPRDCNEPRDRNEPRERNEPRDCNPPLDLKPLDEERECKLDLDPKSGPFDDKSGTVRMG